MKRQYTLDIAGEELKLRSDDEPKYVQHLAHELTKKINYYALSGAGASKLQAAIVCALDLLDENYRLKSLMEGTSEKDGKKSKAENGKNK